MDIVPLNDTYFPEDFTAQDEHTSELKTTRRLEMENVISSKYLTNLTFDHYIICYYIVDIFLCT